MDRPVGLVLVALLVVPASVTVVATDGMTPDDGYLRPSDGVVTDGTGATVTIANGSNGTVRKLSVGDGTAVSGFFTPNGDLSAAVEFGDAEFRSQMLGYTAVQRLEAAGNETARRSVVRNALDDAQARVEELRDTESAAVRAYYEGEIGIEELLRRLGRVDAQAGSLSESVSYLRSVGGDQGAFTFRLRQRSLWIQSDIGTFETVARDSLNRSFRGSDGRPRVHVVATADGFALETIVDGTYVRDAVRFDNYEPNEGSTVGIDDVIQLAYERYPSLELNPEDPRHRGPLDPIGQRLWRLGLQYPQGTSTVYFDRSTGDVYREIHRLDLGQLPTETVTTATRDDVRVVVNRTDEGNPYLVRVLDADTGNPVDATLSVAGSEVGPTGDDGKLWLLGARGEFTLGVDTGSQTLNVSVPA